MKIPKLSAPLTKAIRTAEGIFVGLLNLGLVLGASIPSAHLSVKEAATLAAVNNGMLLVQRGSIKVVALLKGVGLAPDTSANSIGALLATPVATEATKAVATAVGDVAADTSGKTPSGAAVEGQVEQLVTDAQEIASPPPADPAPAATA